jgi:type IV secretory pathway TraG/TraD family ATPase VirD4
MIDEFAAVAAAHISKLFGKARTAGISLLLGTQEFADLQAVGAALKEQTIGNLDALVAHRQNVPQSAELIAKMSGTQEAWIPTEQTESGWLGTRHSGKGTRRRGEEFRVHPNQIMQLRTGNAVVLTPGTGTPVIASMLHPTHASP